MLDCSTCTDRNSARTVARANSRLRSPGEYPTVVFNTASNVIYQFDVGVEQENGIVYVFATNASLDPAVEVAFNSWTAEHGYVARKDIDVQITCPASEEKCGYGDPRNTNFLDLGRYIRGQYAVNSELVKISGIIDQVKLALRLMTFKITITFPNNNDVMKLQLFSAYTHSPFTLISLTDQNGTPIPYSVPIGGTGASGAGSASSGSASIYVSGGVAVNTIDVTICIDGECVTRTISTT